MILSCCKKEYPVTAYQVANELKMSVQAIHQYLKRSRVKPVKSGYRGTPALYDTKDIAEAYRYWHRRFKFSDFNVDI
ncbi:hypothetical protein LCGC14_1189150 [marine sediment metagenome]|uniref:HTH merR-type domain-containing protein n=1 Tax=marine sediment metagenome TaxID=412755 RepID=A0A0F9PQB5_9ZZZZ